MTLNPNLAAQTAYELAKPLIGLLRKATKEGWSIEDANFHKDVPVDDFGFADKDELAEANRKLGEILQSSGNRDVLVSIRSSRVVTYPPDEHSAWLELNM